MKRFIDIQQLSKAFEGPETGDRKASSLEVLSGVTLSVEQNQFVSLVGPSGCGKSTLLKLIAGLDKAFEGELRLEGRDPRNARIPVCYMLQKDCLMPWRTMLSNILLPLEIQKGDLFKAKKDIQPLLEEFGLSGFEDYRPHQLSGGMRQRAALLRTYLMEGNIMLLDEPFGALDEITRIQMQDWLLAVWQKHRKTVLFVTHHVEEAIYLSDRVAVMSNRPGTLLGEVNIGFERPRKREMLLSLEFLEYKRRILELLGSNA